MYFFLNFLVKKYLEFISANDRFFDRLQNNRFFGSLCNKSCFKKPLLTINFHGRVVQYIEEQLKVLSFQWLRFSKNHFILVSLGKIAEKQLFEVSRMRGQKLKT